MLHACVCVGIATKKWYQSVTVAVRVPDWLNSQGHSMFALTGKGSSRFSSTGDAKAPAPFPGGKLLTWQHGTELIPCFPNLTAQRESCWQVWQVFECISNPRQGRNDLNNWAALFVPVCWFFEVTSVIYRWGRKLLLPDICSDRGGAACPGMLEPSALSAAGRGAWRCNYSSDSSFELFSAGSGFLWVSGENRDSTDA